MFVRDLNIGDMIKLGCGTFHVFQKETNGNIKAVRAYVHVNNFSYGNPERAIYYLGYEEMPFYASEEFEDSQICLFSKYT
jgi:hypothetical protein